jgi:hypothetical protein
MEMVTLHVVAESDGELHLKDLPINKGEHVEVTLRRANSARTPEQAAALERLISRAREKGFHSTKPYPKRDELYDRP